MEHAPPTDVVKCPSSREFLGIRRISEFPGMYAVCELGCPSPADYDCAWLEELLNGVCSFGVDFVRLDVSQETGGGWEVFSIVDILEPQGVPEKGREETRRDRMSCGGGSLIGNEEASVMLVIIHPPLVTK